MVRARRESCFLCSNKRGPKRTLHKFPKNPATQMAWIKFCGLNKTTDDVKNLYLCSFHFQPSDYQELRASEHGKPLKLKPNTVPSILRPNRKTDKETEVGSSHQALLQDPDSVPQFLAKVEAQKPCQFVQVFIKEHIQDVQEMSTPIFDDLPLLEEPENVPHFLVKVEAEEPSQFVQEFLEVQEVHVEDVPLTPKIEKVSTPRYMGDIKTPDLATPRRAEHCILLAKAKISEQALKIKTLRQQNRRFLKKIHAMGELINQLRKKNLILENSQKNLNGRIKGVGKRKKNKGTKIYSPEF